MPHFLFRHRVIGLLFALVPLAPVLPAQESGQARGQESANETSPETTPMVFEESVSTYLVDIDVRVTDRRGRAVSGLGVEDFTLREDGEKVEITHFNEVRPVAATSETPETSAPSEVPRAIRQEDGLLVFLIDDLTLPLAARKRALADLKEVAQSGITTFTALATVDGELNLVAQPTTESAILIEAIDSVASPSPRGLARQREQQANFRDVLTEIGETRQEVRSGLIEAQEGIRYLNNLARQVEGEALRRRSEHKDNQLAIASLLDALAPIRGRKAIIYISGGVEMRPGQAELDAIQEALGQFSVPAQGGASNFSNSPSSIDARSAALGALTDQAPRRSFRQRQEKGSPDELGTIAAIAAHADVSFYPWRALGSGGVADASMGREAALGASPRVRRARESSLNAGLEFLADKTGGEVAIGSGLKTLIAQAKNEFGGYYSLGFSPEHGGDDEVHRLKVKVRGRGLRVWAPENYLARPAN